MINVQTEGSGDILEINNSLVVENGAMVWDGSKWIVNKTDAHKFFVDVRTGDRLKHGHNPQVYQGTSPTGLIGPFGNYTITPKYLYLPGTGQSREPVLLIHL